MTYYMTGAAALLWLLLLCGAAVGQWQDEEDAVISPLTPEERCRAFSIANFEVKEFYSPLHPGNYPNNTDCTLRIEAEFGFIIRVDFRDYFEIEPSEDCENDFLEIRDGRHGFSDLMGRFCGSQFPPIITSKNRYLWLRFRSDENLEYKGFRAVYTYIVQKMGRPKIPSCHFERGDVAGTITNEDIPEYRFNYSTTYRMAIDCMWAIRVAAGHKIYLLFDVFDLDQPNECNINFVDLYEGQLDLKSRMKHFCGSIGDSVVTSSNTLFLRYFAVPQAKGSKFRAYYTAFRERIPEGEEDDNHLCHEDEYNCEDSTCIDASLECNGIKNCRHEYDEDECSDLKKLKFDIRSQHIIIILTMGIGLLGGMCFALCFNCIRKLISDGRVIHENIRRSREQLEDRPRSMTTIPATPTTTKRPHSMHDEYIAGPKTNGKNTCIRGSSEESDEDDDLDDELDELDEETSVEMRDCECQTRDSLSTQLESIGTRTPPPPPPPSRRPPGVPPSRSPDQVPTPPPPPTSHYGRPQDHYEVESDDPYRYRAHAIIHVPEKTSRTPSKAGKTTPDVLVTH